jgi:anti-anti-sigma factor
VISETHLEIEPGASPGTYLLAGEIDMATAPSIAEISPRRHGAIILDFTHVTFIDSIGIWALVNLVRGMDGGTLVIKHASGNVKRTLDLVDLSDAPGIVLQD